MFEQEKELIKNVAWLIARHGDWELARDLNDMVKDFPNLTPWQMNRLAEALRWTEEYVAKTYEPDDPARAAWEGIVATLWNTLRNPARLLSAEYGPFDALMERFNKTTKESDLPLDPSARRRIANSVGPIYRARIGTNPGKYVVITGDCEEGDPRKIASIINSELKRIGYTPLTSAVQIKGGKYTYVAEVVGLGPSWRGGGYYDEYRERMRRYGR